MIQLCPSVGHPDRWTDGRADTDCAHRHTDRKTHRNTHKETKTDKETHTHTYRETPQISALKFRGTWSCALLNGLDAAGHLEEVPSLVCFPVNPYS